MWQHILEIDLERQMKENCRFKSSLDYILLSYTQEPISENKKEDW